MPGGQVDHGPVVQVQLAEDDSQARLIVAMATLIASWIGGVALHQVSVVGHTHALGVVHA